MPVKNDDLVKLPPDIKFYVNPLKKYYKPYEGIKLSLKVNKPGSFQKNYDIKSNQISKIQLTELTKVNNNYTYNVDWKNIHRNFHGYEGKTTRATWYLDSNWNNIIPQKPGTYVLQFNISTPVAHWVTDPIQINIYIPPKDIIPFDELLSNNLHVFFEYRYSARMYNDKWSTYPSCPKTKLPYEGMQNFVKKYPYFYLTKILKAKLQKTKNILISEHTKYDIEDMEQVNILLDIIIK